MDVLAKFLQQLINGIHVGSIYALIALGYTMVYGIIKLINFAHGDIIMMGAYFTFVCIVTFNLPIGVALITPVILCLLSGILIERVAYKPLRNSPRLSALITAIGVSFLLENVFFKKFGQNPIPFPQIINPSPISLGPLQISRITFITVLISVLLMILLDLFIKKTKPGKAMRAVSEDPGAAQLMGINVNSTISLTFATGSALGAVGGILYSIAYPLIDPFMGVMPGLKAFVAAVLGGIGIIPGAMLGGFIMGIAESLTKGYISSQLADAVVFGILIVVLSLKPSGLLGKNVKEKV
ncbi:MAG TPA: branched-chain amino acid ABC transporter permease [Defluviitaleaceae bacterium]|jgi:branched-chain amino acid transport system permease protein|nr:branched-chain amino acid ABC transporter permease [Defluviitaleaceae bacterium]HPT75295.1 branched-chain amino acid ABC transporter permease [Defluviitaleaceae bacterium]